MSKELLERMENFYLEGTPPCGEQTISMRCYTCSVLRPKEVQCPVENAIELRRTSGYCETSKEGKLCGECTHFGWGMDDCSGNGFIAAIYRLVMGITEDDRKFEPSDRKGGYTVFMRDTSR